MAKGHKKGKKDEEDNKGKKDKEDKSGKEPGTGNNRTKKRARNRARHYQNDKKGKNDKKSKTDSQGSKATRKAWFGAKLKEKHDKKVKKDGGGRQQEGDQERQDGQVRQGVEQRKEKYRAARRFWDEETRRYWDRRRQTDDYYLSRSDSYLSRSAADYYLSPRAHHQQVSRAKEWAREQRRARRNQGHSVSSQTSDWTEDDTVSVSSQTSSGSND
jgi:hypothetical protein